MGSFAPPPRFEFGPAVAAAEANSLAATHVRPRLTRARSSLRGVQAPEPVRSHSSDPRRRKQQEREDSIDTTTPCDTTAGPLEDPPRRVHNAERAHGGARTERQSRAGEGRVGDQIASLTAL